LDFWTYCCINCMHVLPDLEWLEDKYADQPFVVIGVHSAKFENEGDRASIRNAIFRYDIHHPVLIDTGMQLWSRYGVRAWPTFVIIGPDGRLVGYTSGEGKRDLLDAAIARTLEQARAEGTLAEQRIEITPDQMPRPITGLSFPGKVLAVPPDPATAFPGLLAVADSSHNRVVLANWPDADGHASIRDIFGSGDAALTDARTTDAAFNDPQGLAFDPTRGDAGTIYVADTKNHAVRAIDLATGNVSTIVGTGTQGRDIVGGRRGTSQPLASPWDVELSADAATLYVAIAGTHQLWAIDLTDGPTNGFEASAIAGGTGEALVDDQGLLALLAQPSGLAMSADGRHLFFADSESSAIRLYDTEQDRVATIIGTGLFDFGDVDGAYPDARLQHCLDVAVYPTDAGERLLVADTYNDRIKLINPGARTSQGFLGVGRGSSADTPPDALRLAEPGGLCFVPGVASDDNNARPPLLFIADTNNHRVVMVDTDTGAHREIIFDALVPPRPAGAGVPTNNLLPPSLQAQIDAADPIHLALTSNAPAALTLAPTLPEGASINTEAPLGVRVWRLPRDGERMLPRVILQSTLPPSLPATIAIPAAEVHAGALWAIELAFAWCEHGTDATCRPGEVLWLVEAAASDAADDRPSPPLVAPVR
ncbi:MAG: hypothetical protein KDA05_12545, partial [Phycisphaerales bacterium]|nr:hypothetical protein [Phycisphaerales bacterium]